MSGRAKYEPGQKTIRGIVFPAIGVYLAVILDLHSRRVIGWAIAARMKKDLAIRALNMAIALRRPPKGCSHHTDRGSQYCSRSPLGSNQWRLQWLTTDTSCANMG